MGVGQMMMKRIPRIQFPNRHAKSLNSSSGSVATSQTKAAASQEMSGSDVPASPANTAVGGKASLQPKRTPVSEREIEAIMLGGSF